MLRKILPFAVLMAAAMILTRAPGPHEPVSRPLPAHTAWRHAERMLVQSAPPAPDDYEGVLRELETVCGDPAGALLIERTLQRWPEFAPAVRARQRQAIRHGQAPLPGAGCSPLPALTDRRR